MVTISKESPQTADQRVSGAFSDDVAVRMLIASASCNVINIKKILESNRFMVFILAYRVHFSKKNSLFCFTRRQNIAKENKNKVSHLQF